MPVERRRFPFPLIAAFGLVTLAWFLLGIVSVRGLFAALRHLSVYIFGVLPVFLALGSSRLEGKRLRVVAWSLTAGLVAVYLWSTRIEPYWLEVSHFRIESPKLEEPLRLVLVADLQTDRWGSYEEKVIRTLAEQEPDLLIFTGDYFQAGADRRQQLAAEFQRTAERVSLRARLGAYAVGGDVEGLSRGEPEWPSYFDGLSIEAIPRTKRFDAFGLTFTALSLTDSRFRPATGSLVKPSQSFHIVFGHAPDFALDDPPADLMLAGHTHGGQVRLPFLGPVLTLSAVPRSWAAGRTDFEDGRTLIVSRGIGMERGRAPRLRFLCRPELVVVDLVPVER